MQPMPKAALLVLFGPAGIALFDHLRDLFPGLATALADELAGLAAAFGGKRDAQDRADGTAHHHTQQEPVEFAADTFVQAWFGFGFSHDG